MFELRPPIDQLALLPWEGSGTPEAGGPDLPAISIVIPIYNSGAFLERTLRSLLCNDLAGVELILMDGGSNDNTMEIVDYYADIFTAVVSEPDRGQSDAINKGFEKATSDVFYWLNGDDLILPNALTQVRKYFAENVNCQVLVGNAHMTELDLSSIHHFVFSPEKLSFDYLLNYAQNHLIQPSVFFTRNAWESSGPLNVEDHYAMDADLFIGMARSLHFDSLDLDIAYSVYHEGCKTRGARAESITSLALVQAKHGGLEEARSTLDMLVGLYRELEQDVSVHASKSGEDAVARHTQVRIDVLEAKLAALEAHQEGQKKLFLKLDLEMEA